MGDPTVWLFSGILVSLGGNRDLSSALHRACEISLRGTLIFHMKYVFPFFFLGGGIKFPRGTFLRGNSNSNCRINEEVPPRRERRNTRRVKESTAMNNFVILLNWRKWREFLNWRNIVKRDRATIHLLSFQSPGLLLWQSWARSFQTWFYECEIPFSRKLRDFKRA